MEIVDDQKKKVQAPALAVEQAPTLLTLLIQKFVFNCNEEHTAKWWYSTAHIVTAMIGAGVLTLPSAMTYLGWGPGMMMLALSWVITLATMYQMIEMHDGQFDTYQQLGQRAFGRTIGLIVVGSQQIIVQVTTNIAYLVAGGHSLRRFVELLHGRDAVFYAEPSYPWIPIFAGLQAALSFLASFSTMTIVSIVASIMSFGYSTIIWATSIQHKTSTVSYHYPKEYDCFKTFNALGEIAFAYGGHNVALEIQATMRSTAEKPSKIPMWNGVLVAYVMVAVCYFPVAGFGYWAVGNQTCSDNILDVLRRPTWLMATADMMLLLHLTGSYQVYALPIYVSMEEYLQKTFGTSLTVISRPVYVATAITCFVAMIIPSFGDLLGLFGGLALVPSTYFLPCIMWLVIKKPRKLGLPWLANWACIVFGVVLMCVAFIGSLVNLIHGFKAHDPAQRYKAFYFPAIHRCPAQGAYTT